MNTSEDALFGILIGGVALPEVLIGVLNLDVEPERVAVQEDTPGFLRNVSLQDEEGDSAPVYGKNGHK